MNGQGVYLIVTLWRLDVQVLLLPYAFAPLSRDYVPWRLNALHVRVNERVLWHARHVIRCRYVGLCMWGCAKNINLHILIGIITYLTELVLLQEVNQLVVRVVIGVHSGVVKALRSRDECELCLPHDIEGIDDCPWCGCGRSGSNHECKCKRRESFYYRQYMHVYASCCVGNFLFKRLESVTNSCL